MPHEIPWIALNYEVLVEETFGRVTNSHLGLLIRGLCWASEHRKPFVPRGVLQIWADDPEGADDEIDTLIEAGLLVHTPGRPKLLHLGEQSWLVMVPKRRPVPRKVRAAIYARDGHRCRRCSSAERLTIDHIRPIARGGTDDTANLQTLCQPCNGGKGARI